MTRTQSQDGAHDEHNRSWKVPDINIPGKAGPLRAMALLLLEFNPSSAWQTAAAVGGHILAPRQCVRAHRSRPAVLLYQDGAGKTFHIDTDNEVKARGLRARDDETTAKPWEAEAKLPSKQFDWFKHWYPVHVVDTMDPTRPHEVQLLGLNLVAWNDGPTVDGKKQAGEWHVFADACPHRMGPLSEGRIEADGNLLCSYHGWRFDGAGDCADLPYSPDNVVQKHRSSCRACCETYPSTVQDGFLWVFPSSGPDAAMECLQVGLPLISEIHDPANKGRWNWRIPTGVRNFPCGWDAMLENTLDPAHFLSAHHGTLSNRYTDPAPYNFKTVRKLDMEEGFAMTGGMGTIEFVPPCLVKYSPDYSGMPFKGTLVIATYLVPTRPGWVRPLANVLLDREKKLGNTIAERALSIFVSGATPDWFGHIASSVVLHQDAGLLYKQYRNLRERGYNNPSLPAESAVRYEKLVFCPNGVDKGVLAFRQWLRMYAGGGIPWACEDVLPPRGTEDIFDMWNAHTKHCQYCQTAYRNLEIVKYVSLALSAIAFLGLPSSIPEPAISFAFLLIAGALQKFNELFVRYEYSHADND